MSEEGEASSVLVTKVDQWSTFGDYIARKVWMSDGRSITEYQHRFVMEKKLKRKLLRSEHVHHKDKNTYNNRLSNLKIISASEHAREHAKERPPEMVEAACVECGNRFQRKARWVRNNQEKQKKAGPFCGKKCAGIRNARLRERRERDGAGRPPKVVLSSEMIQTARQLFLDGNGTPTVAKKLGISRHQARQIQRMP